VSSGSSGFGMLVQASPPKPSLIPASLRASRSYDERTLSSLGPEGLACVHEALLGVDGHYLRRLARVHAPYMRKTGFVEWLGGADAWSLRILCVLAQTKAYLYWCRGWGESD